MNSQLILTTAIKAASPWMQLQVASGTPRHEAWDDAVVELCLPNGAFATFQVEVKSSLTVPVLKYLIEKAPKDRKYLLLVAPFVTRGVAQLCIDHGINYLDTAGNAYLNLPERLIYIAGQSAKNSMRDSLSSSKKAWATASGLRIIFSLLTDPECIHKKYRDIAESSGTALGSVAKTMAELEAAGHLVRGNRLVGKEELARTWAMYYSSVLRPKLSAAKYSVAGSTKDVHTPWRSLNLQHGDAVWGGEEGAYRLDNYLKPASATLYTWQPRHQLIGQLRLKPDPQGSIEILDAFWQPTTGTKIEAPALLIYADLIRDADSRNHEAAENIWPRVIND